jgi:hypothetical protein
MSAFSGKGWRMVAGDIKTAMRFYSGAAWERAMKREEIILRAYAKKISWLQAAEAMLVNRSGVVGSVAF